LIATEFPGQFPGRELYNLDLRDEQFFVREARKKQILRKAELLNSVRMAAWADSGSFSRKLNDLQREFDGLEGMANQIVQDNWEDLKMKKRG